MMCLRTRGSDLAYVEDRYAISEARGYEPAMVYPDIEQFDMVRRWRFRVGEVVWRTASPRGEPAPRDDWFEEEEVEFRAGKTQNQSWDPRTRGPCGVNRVSRDVVELIDDHEDNDDKDDEGVRG